MAANNSNAVQSFSIALIVFVMLTFILAVTTYLFFKKADENLKLKEAAEAKKAAAAARKAAPASAASSGKKRARSEVEADPESDVVSGEATKKRRRPAKKPDENMYKKIYVPKK